jgi:hypothetical protein
MSAASLYDAIHETIAEVVSTDESMNPFELIGVLEQVKHDLLTAGDLDDDSDDADDLDAA